jgi:hypothetical protein
MKSKVLCDKYLKLWKQLWNWVMGRVCKNFEPHGRKSLSCFKEIVERTQAETDTQKLPRDDRD